MGATLRKYNKNYEADKMFALKILSVSNLLKHISEYKFYDSFLFILKQDHAKSK